jgi:hypothetical protein
MLLKMLNKESSASKGSDSDVFLGKKMNFPVKHNQRGFDAADNLENDFSTRKKSNS